MKLSIFERKKITKSTNKKIRLENNIPAVLYSPKGNKENVYVLGVEFEKALRNIEKGRLATTIFSLEKDKKITKAIIKEIQYHKTTYKMLHIDFLELLDDSVVSVKVPIELGKRSECIGVKEGGELRQVLRYFKISCLPKEIPAFFSLDVSGMALGNMKRLKDIDLPKNVFSKMKLNEVVVLVSKK